MALGYLRVWIAGVATLPQVFPGGCGSLSHDLVDDLGDILHELINSRVLRRRRVKNSTSSNCLCAPRGRDFYKAAPCYVFPYCVSRQKCDAAAGYNNREYGPDIVYYDPPEYKLIVTGPLWMG